MQAKAKLSDIGSLGGKILQKRDGSVPSDNPFGNYVYVADEISGFDWGDGFLYVTDHGPIRHDDKHSGKGREVAKHVTKNLPSFRCYTVFTLAPHHVQRMGIFITGLRAAVKKNKSTDGSERSFYRSGRRGRSMSMEVPVFWDH